MIPSLMSRLSKSLSVNTSDKVGAAQSFKMTSSTSNSSHSSVSVLRRQATKELLSEDVSSLRSTASGIKRTVIGKKLPELKSSDGPSWSSVRRRIIKRISRPPLRLVEEDDVSPTNSKMVNLPQPLPRILSRPKSLQILPSKKFSLFPPLSKHTSITRKASDANPSKGPTGVKLKKFGSKSSHSSLVKKRGSSFKTILKKKPIKVGAKVLWYAAGAYLTVRSDEGGFYLCRTRANIYNTTKAAKIRWLGPKTGRKRKRGCRKRTANQASSLEVDESIYELVYQDELDPTSILMEVSVERKGTSFRLNDEDRLETERLLQVAEGVESGKLSKDAIGEDVEEVVIIDYEPPPKRRKRQSEKNASPRTSAEKKPRIKKTLSQKERERAKKAMDKEENKAAKKTAAAERRRKAAVAKQTEDTTLYPNPAVRVLEKDPLWETNNHMPYVSKYANSKLIFRAVQLKDLKLLKKLLRDSNRIRRADHKRSLVVKETPLEFALKVGNKEALEELLRDAFGKTYKKRLEEAHRDNVQLNKLGTGAYNFRSLGRGSIRPLMASRGAREGNNALIKDTDDIEPFDCISRSKFISVAMLNGADAELLTNLMCDSTFDSGAKGNEEDDLCLSYTSTFMECFPSMLARGHNVPAGQILKLIMSREKRTFRYTPSFTWKVLVAKDVSELPSIPPSSIDLKIKSVKGFTMLHIAAANPNSAVLEKVLNSEPNYLVSDSKGLRPIHIAAGNSSPDPLRLLLDRRANPFDADTNGETALHYAIRGGRTKNVQILLDLLTDKSSHFVDPTAGKLNGGINRTNKSSKTLLHLACETCNLDIVNLLIKHGANIEAKTSINSLSVTPLMFAAAMGDLNIVRCLVDAGAIVEQRDRIGRTALMHAAMNGSTRVLSYLLNIGASPNRTDTSGNTPLHYAAAYGWYFSVKLLLDSGADPAVSNDWTTTPLSIAYLKGHRGIVSLLLDDVRVNVNFPNENGETLLFTACSSEIEEQLVEQIRFLIEEKGADCSHVDNNGNTPLHLLASADVYKEDFYMEGEHKKLTKMIENTEVSDTLLEIAKILVKNGCDVTGRGSMGHTPAMLALQNRNIRLAQFLVEQGSPIHCTLEIKSDDKPNTLLHIVANEVLEQKKGDPSAVITFLSGTFTVKGEKKSFLKELCEMAQTFDSRGYTPLLSCTSAFALQWINRHSDNELLTKRQWDNAVLFLRHLIDVAKSDVNVVTRPKWKGLWEPTPDEEDPSDYLHSNQAKWSPVFFTVKSRDLNSDEVAEILRLILEKGSKVNIRDLYGSTPLTLAVESLKEEVVDILVREGGADPNLCMIKSEREENGKGYKKYTIPPICIAAEKKSLSLVEELLNHGADVTQTDERSQSTVLHLLAKIRSSTDSQSALYEKLLDAGLDVNKTNVDGQTALHIIVSNNAGRIDDRLEEEMTLIGRKASLTKVDKDGKTPLHYIFVGIHRVEPVDLCKLLVKAMARVDLNIQDKEGRTPLHYAASRGSSICCMYLMQKGADPNIRDADGNTPLSLAVMAKHDNCGCVLIQNGADLKSPVMVLDPTAKEKADKVKEKNLPAEWKWKPVAMLAKKSSDGQQRPLFQEAIRNNLVGVSFLILEWPIEKSGISLIDAIEMALKNSQLNVALRLLSTVHKGSEEVCAVRREKRNLLHIMALHTDPQSSKQQQEKLAETLMSKGVSLTTEDRYSCTPLVYALYNKNSYLAEYFIGLKLLNLKEVDCFDRNLIVAALWKTSFSGLTPQIRSVIESLAKEQVEVNRLFDYPLLTDVFGAKTFFACLGTQTVMPDPDFWMAYPDSLTTPLIFALHNKDYDFVRELLLLGADPNMRDGSSLTPLMHAVKLNSVRLVKHLFKFDYDTYIDDRFPEKKEPKKKKPPTKTNVFRLKRTQSDLSKTDAELSSDSEKEKEDDDPEVIDKGYHPVKKTSSVNLDATDDRGWTALHYVSCPLQVGTFDNDDLVYVLSKGGAKLDTKNKEGKTPLDLALANNAPKVAAMLQRLMGVESKHQKEPVEKWSDHHVEERMSSTLDYDFHADAAKQLGESEAEMEQGPYEPAISDYCNVTNGSIVRDEEQNLPYEVLLTRCDAHMGEWGLFNFYQIQLVHQPAHNLYVLFTRWGRIGDTGQYQHTPFIDREAAVKEFCKIFRQKSGCKWQDVKQFKQEPKKYKLVPMSERQPPPRQKKIKFDFQTSVKSQLPDDVHSAMKIMVNIKRLENSYLRDVNIDTDVLPFGQFSRERLIKAKKLLEQMEIHVTNITTYRSRRQERTLEEKQAHQEDCQKVSELSSEYFQLIPQKNFVYEKLRPLDREREYKQQVKLITNLLDFEISTKMMLGSMFRKQEVHPLDYIYSCMKCKLQLMKEDDPMVQLILRSAYATGAQKQRIEGVYKVEREGEDKRFRKCSAGNKHFLWHGTPVGNLVSILNRGLICTPLDAVKTGELFGKGIYFSDMFSKSYSYCQLSPDYSCFMLLCEVAVGKQYIIGGGPAVKGVKYNSSFAPGRSFPDPVYNIRLPSGQMIFLGDVITEYSFELSSEQRIPRPAANNEYIVYEENQVCIRYLLQFRG